jgi:Fe-S cluster assembly protein SufD
MLAQFEKFTQTHASSFAKYGASPDVRQKAMTYFAEHGLPTRRQEDWKYTSVKALGETSFVPANGELLPLSAETATLIRENLNPRFINLVFHNGVFRPELSADLATVPGLSMSLLNSSQNSGGATAATALFSDSFEALNMMFHTGHHHLVIAPETSIARTVHLAFFTSGLDAAPTMVHPRFTVTIGAGSSVRILESYHSDEKQKNFVNPSATINVGASAKVVLVRLQAEGPQTTHLGRTVFNLGPFANLHSLVFSTGAELSRHDLNATLKAEGISAVLDGVYLVKGQQHVDNTTLIDHQVGGCNSSQHYKGILADQSRAVFNGKVVISKGAQKANSQQLNNNLLLSRQAEADSKPQLEVYVDDVKASHGSTVGQLNREELFYLESRAISPQVAIPMLSFGYASELIYKVEESELQEWLNLQLRRAFAGLTIEPNKQVR